MVTSQELYEEFKKLRSHGYMPEEVLDMMAGKYSVELTKSKIAEMILDVM